MLFDRFRDRLPIVDWYRVFALGGGAIVFGLAGAAVALGVSALIGGDENSDSPAPAVAIEGGVEPQEPEQLGFPTFAT